MKSSVIKQLLSGVVPILVVFGLGWAGWEYLNGTFQGPTGPGMNTLYPIWEAQPDWWTRWYPSVEGRPISYHLRFSDYSEEGRKARIERLATAKQATESFAPGNEGDQVDKAFAWEWLEAESIHQQFPFHRFELAASGGFPQSLDQFLIHTHSVQSEADVQNFMKRAETLPRLYREMEKRGLAQSSKGTLPAKQVLTKSARYFRELAATPIDSQPLYLGLARKLARLDDVEVNEYEALERLTTLSSLVTNELQPAWNQLAATLDSLESSTPVSVLGLPEGDAYYRQLLSTYSAIDTDFNTLFLFAEIQVANWEYQLSAYLDSMGLDEEMVAAQAEVWDLNDDEAKSDFLARIRKQIRDARPIAYGLTDTLPKDRLDLWPDFLQGVADYQYIPASIDRKRRTRIVLGMGPDNSWTEADRELMVYEQAIPGLHLLTHRQQTAGIRGNLRRTYGHPAIVAGWPAYASYLMDHDLLAFEGNAPLKVAYLQKQRLRAVMALLDLGIHYIKWTPEQAMAYFSQHTELTEAERSAHLWEVIEQPGQAVAAFSGFLFLLELRKEMATELGDTFYLNEYHNALLFEGPLSPTLLRSQMQKWSTPYRDQN